MPYVSPSLARGELRLEDVKISTDVNVSRIVASNGIPMEVISLFHLVPPVFESVDYNFPQRFWSLTLTRLGWDYRRYRRHCDIWFRRSMDCLGCIVLGLCV